MAQTTFQLLLKSRNDGLKPASVARRGPVLQDNRQLSTIATSATNVPLQKADDEQSFSWWSALRRTLKGTIAGAGVGAATGAIVGAAGAGAGALAGAGMGALIGAGTGFVGTLAKEYMEYQTKKRIQEQQGITVSPDVSGVILRDIVNVMDSLPAAHVSNNPALTSIKSGAQGAVSYYQPNDQSFTVNNPPLPIGNLAMPDLMYAALNKKYDTQMSLMDAGAMAGYDYDEALDAGIGLDSGDRHVMGGQHNANNQERLLPWTVRHEIGHAVANRIDFLDNFMALDIFGAWQRIDEEDVPDAVDTDLASNHMWMYDNGGPQEVRQGDRIYQNDDGQWWSYNDNIRQHIVSNYQFRNPDEYFAEVYAAYYNPDPDSVARNALSQAQRNWFRDNLGPHVDARGNRGQDGALFAVGNDEDGLEIPIDDEHDDAEEPLLN